MKRIFLISILAIFFTAGVVNAEVDGLPSAGITPESPFYFLDRIGETLQEFFTFNPEAKAKLQIEFAGERISEISAMVEKDGVGVKGIEKAKTLLLANVAQAATIIQDEKTAGKDVTKLAKNIDDAFDAQEKLLTQTFQDARKKLKKDRIALKKDLTGVDSKDSSIDEQMQLLDKDMGDLKGMQDDLNNLFNNEQKKIEKELNIKDKEMDSVEAEKTDKEDKTEDAEIDSEDDSSEVDIENDTENEDSTDGVEQGDSEDGKNSSDRRDVKNGGEQEDE